MKPEKTALFIDGSNFYAATRLLNMDVDYAKLHAHFSQNANSPILKPAKSAPRAIWIWNLPSIC